jgi:glucan phosphoethanolaminetransferase (alkaline phosphatase superfamily)
MSLALQRQRSLYALIALAAAPYAGMLYFWARYDGAVRSLLALLASAALAALLLAGCLRTWRWFFLGYFPLLLLSAAYAAYALTYGILPGPTLGILILSATREELRGLVMLWPQKWLLLPLAAAVVVYLWLAWRLPAQPIFSASHRRWPRAMLAVTLPLAAYAATDSLQLVNGVALNPLVGGLIFLANGLPQAHADLRGDRIAKVAFHAARHSTDEEVHVLIVGESARRASWSVYGYTRATNPYLEHIKGEVIFLKQAMADANLTEMAVPMILTGVAPREFTKAKLHGTLFDLAAEAGYRTSWLVNQDIDISNYLGISTDDPYYPPEMRPGSFYRHSEQVRRTDEVLLAPFRRELARTGKARFIGLHIMESHWEYARRYPASFAHFVPRQAQDAGKFSVASLTDAALGEAMVDSYDNSVLYTDWLLGQIIEAMRALRVPATLTFVPDHGESLAALDEGVAGHGAPSYHVSQFAIPAFVWVNDAYRAAYPRKVAALRANAEREIRSHDFFYTEADLMGITWPGEQPARSFASEQFAPDTTRLHLVGGALLMRP